MVGVVEVSTPDVVDISLVIAVVEVSTPDVVDISLVIAVVEVSTPDVVDISLVIAVAAALSVTGSSGITSMVVGNEVALVVVFWNEAICRYSLRGSV